MSETIDEIKGKLEELKKDLQSRDEAHASETMILSNAEKILKIIKEGRANLEWLKENSKKLFEALDDMGGEKEVEVRHAVEKILSDKK